MTADLIARAEAYLALAEKATPGPWNHNGFVIDDGARGNAIAMLNLAKEGNCDGPFIAASHEAASIIRELLGERNGR